LRHGIVAALVLAAGWAGCNAVLDRVGAGSVAGLAATGFLATVLGGMAGWRLRRKAGGA
jgi:hypothetical protein